MDFLIFMVVFWGTPPKTNMEPENTPLEKEKHLQIFGFPWVYIVSFSSKKNGTFRCHEAKISMVEPFGHEALANRRSVMCERPDWWAAELGNSWDILNLGL